MELLTQVTSHSKNIYRREEDRRRAGTTNELDIYNKKIHYFCVSDKNIINVISKSKYCCIDCKIVCWTFSQIDHDSSNLHLNFFSLSILKYKYRKYNYNFCGVIFEPIFQVQHSLF